MIEPQPNSTHRTGGGQARHTDMSDLVAILQGSLADYRAGRQPSPAPDPTRDDALTEYRRRLTTQIRGDLAYTLGRLDESAAEASKSIGWSALEEPLIADLFRRVEASRQFLLENDMHGTSALEEKCWIALQQFYCDAIDLAERLLDLAAGRRKRWPQPLSDGTFKRHNFLGIESYRLLQTIADAAEVAIPNVFEMRFRKTLWPTLKFMLRHQFWPWGDLHWADFEATTLGWLGDQGLGRLAGRRETKIRFVGREHLTSPELFDPAAQRFKHNVVIAASHRVGFLDFPLFTEMLRGVPHAVWANNAFYTPGMAKKLAKERTTIPIRGVGKMPMNDALDLTISVLRDDGRALFIMADGSQPNFMYRYQVRIKRGIRVLVDECIRQTAAQGRRTYVIPMTFDDPASYLCGLDEEIVVTTHPPILVKQHTTTERYKSIFNESAINGGDDLINQIEALYLVNSCQSRHGLHTPEVVDSVEAYRGTTARSSLRSRLRRQFNTTAFELSRRCV
jgi:hypothetical protein